MDMRVANAYNAFSVYNVKNTPGAKKADRSDRSDRTEDFKDTFKISTQAEDYQTVRKALTGVPDMRSDRVNYLKAKIESNTYHVSADDVAAKILTGIE